MAHRHGTQQTDTVTVTVTVTDMDMDMDMASALKLVFEGPVWSGFYPQKGATGDCNRSSVAHFLMQLDRTGKNWSLLVRLGCLNWSQPVICKTS